jgi:hypothetical protein
MPCSSIKSKDIVEIRLSLTAKPQTVGNYASHLAAIFAITRLMWDYRREEQEMKDAIKVARRMGTISRSAQRDRRPTLDEVDRLIGHFMERRMKAPLAMPIHKKHRLRSFLHTSPGGHHADRMERFSAGAQTCPRAGHETSWKENRQ